MSKNHDILTVRIYLCKDDPSNKAIAFSDGSAVWRTGAGGTKYEALDWIWLPRSQIEVEKIGVRHILDARQSGYELCDVQMPEWLVLEKGLENHVQ